MSKGLIDNALVFVVQEKLSNYSGQDETGNYLLSTAIHRTWIMGNPGRGCRAGGSYFVIVEERMRAYINFSRYGQYTIS